jgi:hypothetical protein
MLNYTVYLHKIFSNPILLFLFDVFQGLCAVLYSSKMSGGGGWGCHRLICRHPSIKPTVMNRKVNLNVYIYQRQECRLKMMILT